MAKTKRKIGSDTLLQKKLQHGVKKHNPFEIISSKTKFDILNRNKVMANPTTPGVNRAHAIRKRKNSLGVEYLRQHKTNRFIDQRSQTSIANREVFADRKSMASRRKEKFNLNDSIKLTHRGQTLEEIERFDAVDNDDSEEDGHLEADFMEAAHFGGGVNGEEQAKDRKTVIEEMIVESKRRKAEKQKENDEIYEITQRLDQNWQNLSSVMGGHMKPDNVPPKLDDYDRIMREMIFERRGAPTDKLKSEEELINIEKAKRAHKEEAMRARMNDIEIASKATHKSADDLDDSYLIQALGGPETTAHNEDNGHEHYTPTNVSGENHDVDSSDEESDSEPNMDSDESGESEEAIDKLSDLKSDSDCDNYGTPDQAVVDQKQNLKSSWKTDIANVTSGSKMDLPLSFVIPRKYEELAELFSGRSAMEQSIILERMFKTNNLKFSSDNKSRAVSMFAFIVQHLNDQFVDAQTKCIRNSFQVLERLTPHLYDCIQINPSGTALCFQEVLKEKQENFRKCSRQYPQLDTIIFLKLVPVLFSASDFRHPVVSPALVFVSEILSRCPVQSRRDVISGLLLVTMTLECTEKSKRFLPAALNFLNGMIYLSLKKSVINVIQIVPPFTSLPPLNNLLVLEERVDNFSECLSMQAEDFKHNDIDNSFKLRALYLVLVLIRNACSLLSDNPGIHFFSTSFMDYLEMLDDDLLPETVKLYLHETLKIVKMLHSRPLKYLEAPITKPKPLRLLEPKIEPTYNNVVRRPQSQELTIREKRRRLQRKIKKETRAAAREIRQDSEFISKMQFKERAASDRERLGKVKSIMNCATTQQGELNSLDRKAKYRK